MVGSVKPLLFNFEQHLSGDESSSGRDPRGDVTTPDVVYKSTLLDPNALPGGGALISKYTMVRTETTDDE